MKFSNSPEVLAPAGSFDALTAAVRSGADAVYFGLREFNARRQAKNFDLEDLRDAVKYCRTFSVKTYLTLNISLNDKELDLALRTAADAYVAGVDAFIVSDLGLARLLKQNIPDVRLHGSTQLTVHSPSALPILKELEFKRIVLSREMSKKEIAEFCKTAAQYGIETEVFVHGALCMCMSGQCYFSALLGSRSGNRGLCAAPCRLPAAVKNGTGYDLSLKDLSLIKYIDELHSLGVTSFKIEGRMKRPEYVAAAVSACKSGEENTELLKKVFSRDGFSDGYYTSNLGRNMFGTKDDSATPNKATLSAIHALYRTEPSRVPVNITFKATSNEPCVLCMSDGKFSVSVSGATPSKADSKPTDSNTVKDKLSRLGSTPFFAYDIKTELEDGLFIPVSQINALKTEAAEKLIDERSKCDRSVGEIQIPETEKEHIRSKTQFAVYFEKADNMPSDLSCFSFVVLRAEECEKYNGDIPLIAELPRASGDETVIKNLIEKAKNCGAKAALVGNLAHIELCRAACMPFITSFGLNLYNSHAIKLFEDLGAKAHLLNFEQKESELKSLKADKPTGIIAYGKLPLMLTRNCPIKNGKPCSKCDKNGYIADRTGAHFPVRCRNGFSTLYNSVPLYLADKPEIFDGFDFALLMFTDESSEQIQQIINNYKTCASSDFKFTRGLYKRGVE